MKPLPPGRWRKAGRDGWEAWCSNPISREWTDADWQALHRLLLLTNDLDAAKSMSERRLLSTTIRTLERDLGLLRKKRPPTADEDHKALSARRRKFVADHSDPRPWMPSDRDAATFVFDRAQGDEAAAERRLHWETAAAKRHEQRIAEARARSHDGLTPEEWAAAHPGFAFGDPRWALATN